MKNILVTFNAKKLVVKMLDFSEKVPRENFPDLSLRPH